MHCVSRRIREDEPKIGLRILSTSVLLWESPIIHICPIDSYDAKYASTMAPAGDDIDNDKEHRARRLLLRTSENPARFAIVFLEERHDLAVPTTVPCLKGSRAGKLSTASMVRCETQPKHARSPARSVWRTSAWFEMTFEAPWVLISHGRKSFTADRTSPAMRLPKSWPCATQSG